MIKKISKTFFIVLFLIFVSFQEGKTNPIYNPSDRSLDYIEIGWIVEPTWMGDYWSIFVYDPESPAANWDVYEE